MELMKRSVPPEGQPLDEAERQKAPWWKLKKWVLAVASRISDRYGDSRCTVSETANVLSQMFKTHYASQFLLVRVSSSVAVLAEISIT